MRQNDSQLNIRCKTADLEAWRQSADEDHRTLSAWVWLACQEAVRRQKDERAKLKKQQKVNAVATAVLVK
jgi:hypothetical protein